MVLSRQRSLQPAEEPRRLLSPFSSSAPLPGHSAAGGLGVNSSHSARLAATACLRRAGLQDYAAHCAQVLHKRPCPRGKGRAGQSAPGFGRGGCGRRRARVGALPGSVAHGPSECPGLGWGLDEGPGFLRTEFQRDKAECARASGGRVRTSWARTPQAPKVSSEPRLPSSLQPLPSPSPTREQWP